MLLEKYEPRSSREIIGNERQAGEIRRWLASWKKGIIIVAGPAGCGKDAALRLAAAELGYRIVKQGIEEADLGDAYRGRRESSAMTGKKLVVIEDAEFIRSKKRLDALIDESSSPVVLLLGNAYGRGAKGAKIVRFEKPGTAAIEAFLSRVCRNEGINISAAEAGAIAKNSSGDVRAALIDLDVYSRSRTLEARTREESIFEALRAVFTGNSRRAIENYGDYDALLAWASANVAREYRKPGDIARACDCIARADRLRSLISRRQSWGLQKYIPDILQGLPKKRMSIGLYAPPARPRQAGEAAMRKLGTALHSSRRGVADSMAVIKMFLDDEEFIGEAGMTEEEAESLRNY